MRVIYSIRADRRQVANRLSESDSAFDLPGRNHRAVASPMAFLSSLRRLPQMFIFCGFRLLLVLGDSYFFHFRSFCRVVDAVSAVGGGEPK